MKGAMLLGRAVLGVTVMVAFCNLILGWAISVLGAVAGRQHGCGCRMLRMRRCCSAGILIHGAHSAYMTGTNSGIHVFFPE